VTIDQAAAAVPGEFIHAPLIQEWTSRFSQKAESDPKAERQKAQVFIGCPLHAFIVHPNSPREALRAASRR